MHGGDRGQRPTPRKKAPPNTYMKMDMKEAHSTQCIMKDTDSTKAQKAQHAAVRTLHNIPRQAFFRLNLAQMDRAACNKTNAAHVRAWDGVVP